MTSSRFVALAGAVILACLASSAALAQGTPVGRWKTVSDDGKDEKSIVRIVEVDGVLHGSIERLIVKAGEDPTPKCDKCEGYRHNQPVVGMEILWGLKHDSDEPDEWNGGLVLDPENGKTYKAFIELQDGGKKLKLRGYIGVRAFGRSQYWYRVD